MRKLWRQCLLGNSLQGGSQPICLPSHLEDQLCFLLSLSRASPFYRMKAGNAVTSQEASQLGDQRTQICSTLRAPPLCTGCLPEASTVPRTAVGTLLFSFRFVLILQGPEQGGEGKWGKIGDTCNNINNNRKHRTFSSTKMVCFNSRYKTD